MPRKIVLGNSRMVVALDDRMRIRDFFYPHVGLENHVMGHEFKLGLWVNDEFSWLNDWEIVMRYLPETLVSSCAAKKSEIEVEVEINDAIHSFLNIYLKKLSVNNLADSKR